MSLPLPKCKSFTSAGINNREAASSKQSSTTAASCSSQATSHHLATRASIVQLNLAVATLPQLPIVTFATNITMLSETHHTKLHILTLAVHQLQELRTYPKTQKHHCRHIATQSNTPGAVRPSRLGLPGIKSSLRSPKIWHFRASHTLASCLQPLSGLRIQQHMLTYSSTGIRSSGHTYPSTYFIMASVNYSISADVGDQTSSSLSITNIFAERHACKPATVARDPV